MGRMTENEKTVLIETEQRSKSNQRRLDRHESEIKDIREENKALYELSTSIKLIVQDMSGIREDLKDVKQDMSDVKNGQDKLAAKVSEIEHKPAEETAAMWGKVKIAVITAIATMLATGAVGSLVYFVGK